MLFWGAAFAVATGFTMGTVHLEAAVPSLLTEDEMRGTCRIILSVYERTLDLSVVDPATSIAFPTTLKIQSKTPLPTFTLMGVGVRTVSFLGIKVYSVGFYADLSNPNLAVRMPCRIKFLLLKLLEDT